MLNVYNVYLHRTNIGKKKSCQCCILGHFWAFLIAKKKKSNHLTFVLGDFTMVSASLLQLFLVFYPLFNILLVHIMVAEMVVWGSFQTRTLTSDLIREILGSLHFCPSFLIDYLFFKNGLKMSCSALQNIVLI